MNPQINSAYVCYVNYMPNEGKVYPFGKFTDELNETEPEDTNSKQGGFFYKKAIERISSEYELSDKEFPLFAVVTSSTDELLADYENTAGICPPDLKGFYLTSDGINFSSQPDTIIKAVRRVYFGEGESSVFHGDDSILYFDENNKSDSISFTDNKGNAVRLYAEKAEGMIKTAFDLYSEDKIKNESEGEKYKSLILSSRKSGIMTSRTSFIVVENDRQWKQLEDKEKEILDNEYMETYNSPEPGVIVLLSILLGLAALTKLKRRRYSR